MGTDLVGEETDNLIENRVSTGRVPWRGCQGGMTPKTFRQSGKKPGYPVDTGLAPFVCRLSRPT